MSTSMTTLFQSTDLGPDNLAKVHPNPYANQQKARQEMRKAPENMMALAPLAYSSTLRVFIISWFSTGLQVELQVIADQG
jgi:hypothetical protein